MKVNISDTEYCEIEFIRPERFELEEIFGVTFQCVSHFRARIHTDNIDAI